MQSNIYIICSYCGKEVRIINYGAGYLGDCCNMVIYNEDVESEEREADDP